MNSRLEIGCLCILSHSQSFSYAKSIKKRKFKQLHYNKYFETIFYPFLKNEIEETWYKNEGFTEDEFKKGFLPETINFHTFKNELLKWKITFISEFDDHYFTIEMIDWKALNLQIDG